MGIGHVQGMSRVLPDRPEGGAGGELYSEGLWGKREVQSLCPLLRLGLNNSVQPQINTDQHR